MAQTRACAKALRNVLAWVVVLAGYAPTPAEEMESGEQMDDAGAVSLAWQTPMRRKSEDCSRPPYGEGVRFDDQKAMDALSWRKSAA
jgi:hypothetical protein